MDRNAGGKGIPERVRMPVDSLNVEAGLYREAAAVLASAIPPAETGRSESWGDTLTALASGTPVARRIRKDRR